MSAFPPIGNIYAPPWVPFSPVVAGICDAEFDNTAPNVQGQTITVLHGGVPQLGKQSSNQQIFVSSDADQIVREIQVLFLQPAGGVVNPSDLRIRLRDGDGRLITSDYMYAVDLCGPLCPALSVRRGTTVLIDLVNLNAAIDLNVIVVFKSVKRILCGTTESIASPYRPMYRRYSQPGEGETYEDAEFPFELTTTGPQDFIRQTLLIDKDADFLWRGLAGDVNWASNTVSPVGNVALNFYDPSGTALVKVPVNGISTPWGSPIAGMFRECLLSNGAKLTPQWPEIRIPKGGGIDFDASFGAAATLRFSLRGVKVYTECK